MLFSEILSSTAPLYTSVLSHRLPIVVLWSRFVLYTKPLNEMSFSAFVVLVDRVAATVYPELHERAGPREALQALLTERLAPYLRDALRPEADPWRAWHEEPSVDVVLYTLERPIGRIFERFKTASDLAALANPVPSDTRYFADGSHLRHVMDHTDFIKFAKAFGLCPDPLQIPQLMAIARAASLAHPRHVLKRGFHGVRLIEPEFRDAVVRCALAVHGAAGGDPGLCLKRLLDQFSDEYHRLFGVTLTADGEHNVPGPPVRPSPAAHTLGSRDALEGKAPRRRPQKRLDRRFEEVAKAVGGGYCRLQMPLRLALGVRGTVAGHRLGALEGRGLAQGLGGGGGGVPPPLQFQCILARLPFCQSSPSPRWVRAIGSTQTPGLSCGKEVMVFLFCATPPLPPPF